MCGQQERRKKKEGKPKEKNEQKEKSGKLLGRVAAESLWSLDPWARGPSGKVLAVEDINLSLDDIQFRHSAETSGTKPPAPGPHIRALTMEAATGKYELAYVRSIHTNSSGYNNSC